MIKASKKISASILAIFVLYFNASAISDALKIKIINGSTSDETVIRFLPTATAGFDGSFDAYKMFSSSLVVPSIFTNIDSLSHLSINALPTITQQVNVDLYTLIKVAGTYTIQAIELGTGFPANVKLVLEDKSTGMFYNFRNGNSISIAMTVNSMSAPSRFCLHASLPGSINTTNITCSGSNNGSIQISKPGNNNWSYELADNSAVVISSANNINESFAISGLNPGNYMLYTYSNYTLSDTNYVTITEPAAVISEFSNDYETVYLSSADVTFNNNSINSSIYSWNFGDGTFSSDSSISITHQYLSTGNFIVTLTASNSAGCSSSYSKVITVEEDLIPMSINFSDVTCNGQNNGIIQLNKPGNHNWNYELYNSSSVNISSATNIDETYTITNLAAGIFTLYTSGGSMQDDTSIISISEPAPVVADFSSNYDQVYLSTPEITFSNNSQNATSYNWDLGDGSFASDSSGFAHQYLSAGNFSVTLTATNSNGCASSSTKFITVLDDLSTGIYHSGNHNFLSAYQSGSALVLDLQTGSVSDVQIAVYNSLGQAVYNYNGKTDALLKTIQIESNGLYIINCKAGNKVQSLKVACSKQ